MKEEFEVYKERLVCSFKDGADSMPSLLGAKGARLSELIKLGFPVPLGFVVTTNGCKAFYKNGQKLTEDMKTGILHCIEELERKTGKKLGDSENPLLLSVRSSSTTYMPGLSDAVLNIGINDKTAKGLSKIAGNERFHLEAYINFMVPFMHSILSDDVIRDYEDIDRDIGCAYYRLRYENYDVFTADEIARFIKESKLYYKKIFNEEFPDDTREQLFKCIESVYNSWQTKRNQVYRRLNSIPDNQSAAAVIQEMVFGNLGSDSSAGWVFTRDNLTGEDRIKPKFAENSQIERHGYFDEDYSHVKELNKISPQCLEELKSICKAAEKHFKDMQHINLVVERGQLYVLMARGGKRQAEASLNIAVDLANEGIISRKGAVSRLTERELREITLPVFQKEGLESVVEIAHGHPASKGVGHGRVCFSEQKAQSFKDRGEDVILMVKHIRGSEKAEELIKSIDGLVVLGSIASDGAIMARRSWKPCVVLDCERMMANPIERTVTLNGSKINEGDFISVDGTNGRVYRGTLKIVDREREGNFGTFMDWRDGCAPKK